MNTQTTNSYRPSWDDLNPALPPAQSQNEAKLHWLTKRTIAAMPRNTLGLAVLRALGMRPPQRPSNPVTPQAIRESGERIRQMQTELAAAHEGVGETMIQTVDKVEELREAVSRGQAQATFEASIRAKSLRGTLEA